MASTTLPQSQFPIDAASESENVPSSGSKAALPLSRRHFPELDALRGLAVLIVVVHHWHWLIAPASPGWVLLKAAFNFGWTGVDLFFVLSGFLITGILLDSKDSPAYFRNFYVRRILRIFPLYFVVLTAILGFDDSWGSAWSHANVPLPVDRKFYFLFLSNWWLLLKGSWHSNMIGHFWSLAVEEQFYLIWPLLVWLLPRKLIERICIGAFAAAFLFRAIWIAHSGPTQALFENTFARADTLLAGAFCALLVRRDTWPLLAAKWLKPCLLTTFACIDLMFLGSGEVVHTGWLTQSVGFSLLAVFYSSALLIVFRDTSPRPANRASLLRWPSLLRVGRYSFGIYVYHVPIFMISQHLFYRWYPALQTNPWLDLVYMGALGGVTFAVAAASYELVEKRFLAMKERFAPVQPAGF